MTFKIQIATGSQLEPMQIDPSEFGDPHSFTVRLPQYVRDVGKIHLPRSIFSKEIQDAIAATE